MTAKWYNFLKIAIIFTFVSLLIGFEVVLIIGNETNIFFLTVGHIYIIFGIAVFFDFFWGLFLAFQFIHRMRNLMKLTKQFSDSKMKDKDIQFKYIVSKLTILSCTTVLSTIIAFSLFVLDQKFATIIHVDGVINSLCLILSFNFFDKTYKKSCLLCRFCCENI